MTIRETAAVIGSALGVAALTGLAAAPPAGAESSVYVRTESGATRCLVMADDTGHGGGPSVACEHTAGFPQAPIGPAGTRLQLAVVTGSGAFRWMDGNIGGGDDDIVLSYGRIYRLQGWTILPGFDGTRFTNDETRHGMFVSVENVASF